MRLAPIFMLVLSNVFMTYAWYGHLKDLRTKPILLAILFSWCVAFFEYCLVFHVPSYEPRLTDAACPGRHRRARYGT